PDLLLRRLVCTTRPATPAIATLSLHDALPIFAGGGQKEAHAFLDALEIFGLGYSWGGYESLAVHVRLNDRTIARGDYPGPVIRLDRKSTRLNSSHVKISYAVFCLKTINVEQIP